MGPVEFAQARNIFLGQLPEFEKALQERNKYIEDQLDQVAKDSLHNSLEKNLISESDLGELI